MIKKLSIIAAIASISLLGVPQSHAADKEMSIYKTAASVDTFKTLTAAIDAAGKKTMLNKDEGPFTVFAPTDEAFAALPEGTLDELLKPENKEKLGKILAYHVVPGKVMAADVKTMKADTANGAQLDVKVEGDTVMVNDAKVVKTDIPATNGVIHVIDKVLLPPM